MHGPKDPKTSNHDSSANALSRVVTRGKGAIYLLRRIFRYGHSYRGTGATVRSSNGATSVIAFFRSKSHSALISFITLDVASKILRKPMQVLEIYIDLMALFFGGQLFSGICGIWVILCPKHPC
jgi:hypothetical protein